MCKSHNMESEIQNRSLRKKIEITRKCFSRPPPLKSSGWTALIYGRGYSGLEFSQSATYDFPNNFEFDKLKKTWTSVPEE